MHGVMLCVSGLLRNYEARQQNKGNADYQATQAGLVKTQDSPGTFLVFQMAHGTAPPTHDPSAPEDKRRGMLVVEITLLKDHCHMEEAGSEREKVGKASKEGREREVANRSKRKHCGAGVNKTLEIVGMNNQCFQIFQV